MKTRFIDRFEVLLLDMGKTFMFDVDRFGPDDRVGDTYRRLGGKMLSEAQAFTVCADVTQRLFALGKNPVHYDAIPTVRTCLEQHPIVMSFPESEKMLLEDVIAEQEFGVIPEPYIQALRQLRRTHRMGLISDIWSRSDYPRAILARYGLLDLFEVLVFSSDLGSVKPSPRIFQRALTALSLAPACGVYIGDSLRRDVAGARGVGLAAIWINRAEAAVPPASAPPDHVVTDLRALL